MKELQNHMNLYNLLNPKEGSYEYVIHHVVILMLECKPLSKGMMEMYEDTRMMDCKVMIE